jgi:hypothetical protein
MTPIDDFAPMVEHGELEPTTGLRGRMRRRHDSAHVDAGFVRVLIAENGSPIPTGELTAGEKRWGRAQSWVKVDVSHHTLDYAIPFSDPTGRAGFTARVSVRACVADPGEVAKQGIVSAKDFLLPAVRRVVVQASTAIKKTKQSDPTVALTEMHTQADLLVRNAVQGPVHEAPPWLDAEFVSAAVEFDSATERHHAELVNSTRRGELIDAHQVNDVKATRATLAVRAIWREELLPHLSDPAQRVFEVAFANPSQQNLARAVDQVTGAEGQFMLQGLEVLKTMIEKDYVDKDDPFYKAIEAMSGKLAHVYLPGAAAALASPTPPPELDSGSKTAHNADAEAVVDHDPPDVDEVHGDREWRE